jgi:diguanylate cyclase (GGDEF)-like protein
MAQLSLSRSVNNQSERPFIVSLMDWYRENRQAATDLILLLVFGNIAWFLLYQSDAFEAFYSFSRLHENWELDDLVLTSSVIFSVCFMIFATRRWIEAVHNLRQANTDSLTGLFNRRKGWEIIEAELDRAIRYHRPLPLIMFDIDQFKEINDTYGHLSGDHVLRSVSKRIRESLRKTDSLVKWGGDEFIVVCVETGLDEARRLAERLRSSIESLPVQSVDHLKASFGVTRFKEDDNFDSFIRRVDEKLYEAKSQGKNRVAYA